MKISICLMELVICLLFLCRVNAQDTIVSSDSAITKQYIKASSKFMSEDYEEAIPLYRDLLKYDTSLTKNFWYVLIDNLGMAYGITGNLKSAEETFKYGLSKDSTYPLFYYNLACINAERNNLDSCISYLRIAFRFKNKMIEGESFPDPATDDSFQRYMKNEKFLKVVKELHDH